MNKGGMLRVTRNSPCPICQKPDWCGISEDGQRSICMRIDSGRPAKNGGYIHFLDDDPIPISRLPKKLAPAPTIDCMSLWMSMRRAQKPHGNLASELGVQPWALNTLGVAWSYKDNAWAFPMHDGEGNVIGIRVRSMNGKKWAVAGSRNGLFLPLEFCKRERIVVCEGPTDTAAAMSLALPAIGRPSCSGGVDFIKRYCSRAGCRELVILADRDKNNVGRNGAIKLAEKMPKHVKVKIVSPHRQKDVRKWLQSGATPSMVKTVIENAKWL